MLNYTINLNFTYDKPNSNSTFLTRPNPPTNLTCNFNTTHANLSWIKNSSANKTVLTVKIGSSPSNPNDGTVLYNGTGEYYIDSYADYTSRFYRAWSYLNWTYNPTLWHFSSDYSEANTTYTIDPPYNGSSAYDYPYLNITWSRGNRSSQEIVVSRNDTWSTSATQPGNWIRQNSTNTWFNVSETQVRYYTIWSYNLTDNIYSVIGLNSPWGTLILSCFNENDMSQGITFNVEITNSEATQSYVESGLTNYHFIDLNDIPLGDNTIFIFTAIGYRQRTYYYNLAENVFYNLTAYLIPIEIPVPPGGGGEEDCQLLLYSDSVSVTNPAVDTTITLTHELEEIVTVDIYNSSLYGTYGGWIVVSTDKFTYNSTHVVVNSSVLDVNTTMARATYYYEYCGDINSILCQITIINEYDQCIPDAKCTVQRFNNVTETYVNISVQLTDGNGQFTVWLEPFVNYHFVLYKENYIQQGSKFWTPSPSEYIKTFRLAYDRPEPPEEIRPQDIITFNAYFVDGDNNTLYVNFTDISDNTTDGLVTIYQNGTINVYHVNLTNSSYNFTWTNANHSLYDYEVVLYIYNHSNIGNWSTAIIIPKYISPKEQFVIDLDIDISAVLGENPLGWVNCFILFFGMVILTNFGRRWAGISIMGLGGILVIAQLLFGLPGFTAPQLAAIPFFFVYGALVEIAKGKKDVRI